MVFGVLAQLAEFERATLIERTNTGLAVARKRGTHLGRRFRLTWCSRCSPVPRGRGG